MVIKFTSQTITCDSEIIYIGKIVYVKKSSKSYRKITKPKFTPQEMALPRKLALAILVLYLFHFFTDLSFYVIGDIFCIIGILTALLWDRNRRIVQKASSQSDTKTAFFLELRWDNGGQIYLASEYEEKINDFFSYLSTLYQGEPKPPFESDNINKIASLDGPTLFPNEYELVVPAGQKNDGNKKKSIGQIVDTNIERIGNIANETLENFTEKLAQALEQERQMWRAFSFKAFWQARKNDWQRRKEYKVALQAFLEKLKTKLKL